jgi:hypothetical protein
MLSDLSGVDFSWQDYESGLNFTNHFSEIWNKYNDQVFSFYGNYNLVLADFWIAYFIKPKKGLVPFSDPLTIFINEDIDDLVATVVHELCHVLQTYPTNIEIQKKMYDHVSATYPENSFGINAELVTAVMARPCLIEIFGLEKANTILQKERSFPILGKAWKIIDAQPDLIKETDPIKAVMALTGLN